MLICRSRAPEPKSGIETEPNGPNRCQQYGIQGSKLPKYKIPKNKKHVKTLDIHRFGVEDVWFVSMHLSSIVRCICQCIQLCSDLHTYIYIPTGVPAIIYVHVLDLHRYTYAHRHLETSYHMSVCTCTIVATPINTDMDHIYKYTIYSIIRQR